MAEFNETIGQGLQQRNTYEEVMLNEFRAVKDVLKGVGDKVSAIELQLAATNLVELKMDVRQAKETLQKFDLEKLTEKVEKSEKFVTRAMAILAFIQVIIGVLALFRNYIFQ